MALNKDNLKTALISAFNNANIAAASVANPNPATILSNLCNELATAIDSYIKTASLTVPGTGLIAPTGGGTVTGTSTTGTIS